MKKLLSALLVLAMLISLASCGAGGKNSLKVLTLKGPTGIGMTKIMADCDDGTSDVKCSFTIASSPDEITGDILQGNFDIAAVPSNLAAVLYNKAPDVVRVAGINVMSVLYILENGDTVNSIEDLEGKTLYATGQGSTPEFILGKILQKSGVNCTVEYVADHAELANRMASGEVSLGMLPVPNSTVVLMKNQGCRIALDIGETWYELFGEDENYYDVIQGCIIVNKKTLDTRADAVEKFMLEYAESVNYMILHTVDASKLAAKYELVPTDKIAENAIPTSNIVMLRSNVTADALTSFWGMLYDSDPKSVGGKVPDENIFYYAPEDESITTVGGADSSEVSTNVTND